VNLRIRLHFDRHDGWVFAVCKHGSWRALMTFSSRGEALGAIS